MTSKSLEKFFENIALLETREDVLKAYKALQERLSQLDRKSIREFDVGDKVRVAGRKANFDGMVTKVNRKTVQVRENSNRRLWSVSPSFLTLI